MQTKDSLQIVPFIHGKSHEYTQYHEEAMQKADAFTLSVEKLETMVGV